MHSLTHNEYHYFDMETFIFLHQYIKGVLNTFWLASLHPMIHVETHSNHQIRTLNLF